MTVPLGPRLVHPDLRLAERCVAGERAAQLELFHAHKRRVHATLYRIMGSNGSIDDLIQESFLNVFRSLRTYRGESSLATWIDRCTVRVAYAWIAQRKARPPQLELVQEVAAGAPSAEQRTLAREAARHVYAEIDRLEARLRVAFTLHAIDGRPLAEVAALMDTSLVATKSRVFRARRILAERARRDPVLAAFVSGQPSGREKVA